MTTLLALYRRPDGGPEAQATFERRYTEEHLPLVAGTPGLRETRVGRVSEALGGETDLILVTIDALRRPGGPRRGSRARTRCAPPAATCARSPRDWPRSSCSRTCRRWTPRLPRPWILSEHSRGRRDQDRPVVCSEAASRRDPRRRPRPERRRPRFVRVEFPAPAPASAAPASVLPGVALVTLAPARGAQRPELRARSTSSRRRSNRSMPTRPAGRSSSPARVIGRSRPGPTSVSSSRRRRRR